ncbi:hypothetical protein R3X25_04290 [Lutibacter sp. TH_r2]|uniref:tetratricopeptide repeat protein n=1 Tax=Lutibacter sp. TH_r2 TaxID=3082083 RepID=UPI002953BFDC|nr:hypothetical protein [Lutibacter sp. TH_r2]MDV7186490.1 hypothetical protein [Lutibacter sp. TH_r2]
MAVDSIAAEKQIVIEEQNYLKFQEYFFEALKQKSIKNYSKAIESLEKCYEIYPSDLSVEFEFSKNYYFLRNFNEAELFINKAIEKEPNNNYLLAHKVEIYKKQRNYVDAIEIQEKINQLDFKYADELVLLYIQNKQLDQAEKLITEIENKALSSRRIKSFKIYIERIKNPIQNKTVEATTNSNNTSLESLREEFNKNKDYQVLLKLLNKEIELETFEFLDKDSKLGIELYPAQPVLYKLNGYALNKLGKYNEAIAVLTIGIDFVFDNNKLEAEFCDLFALSYQNLNETSKALSYKKKAEALRKGI